MILIIEKIDINSITDIDNQHIFMIKHIWGKTMGEYNIFLCYRGDKGGWLASNIYSELKLYTKEKLSLFFAPKCISKGENFKNRCEAVAGDVNLMILILSPGFFDNCGEPDD